MSPKSVRSGAETKAEAQRIAVELFTSQGFDATSLREIAEALGVSKAALYYHFPSKEAIVLSALSDRGSEASELLAWARGQSVSDADDLLERTVLRWVDSLSVDKLRGIRFALANPALMRNIKHDPGHSIRDGLSPLAELLAGPDAEPERVLLVRMAFLSINAAVAAASGTTATDDEIVDAARASAVATLAALRRG